LVDASAWAEAIRVVLAWVITMHPKAVWCADFKAIFRSMVVAVTLSR